MSEKFNVFVTTDARLSEKNYKMGLDPLIDDSEFNVVFMDDRPYRVLKPSDIHGANGIVLSKDTISDESLEDCNDLKIISRFGAGIDTVDVSACTEHNIIVTNAPQGVRDSVAQSTVGMLIVCASNLRKYDALIRKQGFEGRYKNMGIELFDKTLGLIGYGEIGSRVVELLEPFDMDIKVFDPYVSKDEITNQRTKLVDFEEVLQTSDFVSLHCPLTEETKGMIGKREFQKMKSDAYLVNTTRGGIYSDKILAQALDENLIAGAAIDVFEDEPNVEENPLLRFDHCLVTPHAAGINKDGLSETGNIISQAMKAVKSNEIPNNIVNPSVYDCSVPEEKLSPSYIS